MKYAFQKTIRRTEEQRFWAKVNKDGALILDTKCWEWTGVRRGRYAQMGVNRCRKRVYVHRFSYALHFGECPEDMLVCHRCDNPSCVNPEHLFLGKNKDNSHDCLHKGRSRWAVLTVKDVVSIRERVAGGESARALGREYGVAPTTIENAVRRKTWRSVGETIPKK